MREDFHDEKYGRWAFAMVSVLTLFRFWYAGSIDLVADEAYYWLWSEHLDYCYFSKGPLVAWTIFAGTALLGDSVSGIRLFSVLLSAGTACGIYFLARELFNPRAAFFAVLAASVIPLFSVGSVLMTIDPLSLFFWVWAAFIFWRAKDAKKLWPWLLMGACIGLGMLAKYTNAVQIFCFLLFAVLCAPYRKLLFRKNTYAMIAVAVLFLSPVVFWNWRRDWVTVTHLVHRGELDQAFEFKPGDVAEFLAMQGLVISPLLWLGMLGGFALVVSHARNQSYWKEKYFLACLFWPLFLFYVGLSFKETGEANWTAPCYLAGVCLAGYYLSVAGHCGMLYRSFCLVALVLALSLTAALHFSEQVGFSSLGIKDPMDRVRGHEDFARQAATIQGRYGADFMIANKYSHASLLCFYHPARPRTYLPSHEGVLNQYSFWPGYTSKVGRDALFLTDSMDEVPDVLGEEFADVFPADTPLIEIKSGERTIRKFRVFVCKNLKPKP